MRHPLAYGDLRLPAGTTAYSGFPRCSSDSESPPDRMKQVVQSLVNFVSILQPVFAVVSSHDGAPHGADVFVRAARD